MSRLKQTGITERLRGTSLVLLVVLNLLCCLKTVKDTLMSHTAALDDMIHHYQLVCVLQCRIIPVLSLTKIEVSAKFI